MTRWLLPFLLLLLAACVPNTAIPINPTSSNPTPAPTVSPESSPTAILNTATNLPATKAPDPPPPPVASTQYILQASLDYSTKRVDVSQSVHYQNTTGSILSEILFVVEANWEPGVFQLISLVWDDGSAIEASHMDHNLLRIPLRDSLDPDEGITLELEYQLNLPAQPGVLGFDWRQINLGNWYPYLPPYPSDTGWLAYPRGWVGEHYSYDLADYTVEITLTGVDTPLVVAASAPGENEGNTHRFYLPNARSFAMSISPEYHIFSKMVGEVEVLSYTYPETLAAGEQALNVTADALALYEDLFGLYPHKTMTVVQVNFPDGLEFDGLYFLSEQYYWGYTATISGEITAQNLLTIIAAHETAHQWWYGRLGNDQAVEPWLDESFATYSELIFYDHYYPELVEWWWGFRIDSYNPQDCCVGDSIYKYGDVRAYINAVYLRGALFMQELRDLMGDEAFFAALKSYAETHQGGLVTANDFWSLLGAFSEQDLTPLRHKYFADL